MKNKYGLLLVVSITLLLVLGCGQTVSPPEWTKALQIAEKLERPSALTTDGKFVYFVTGGHLASLKDGTSGVWKIALSGGQPELLVKGTQKDANTVFLPDTFVLATDEKYLYFAAGSIYRILKSGGEPEKLAAGTPTEMVLDDENIYWHNFVGEGMSPTPVYSVKKTGGEVRVMTEAATIIDIAVDADYLYWAQPDGIYKSPKKGGGKTRMYGPENGGRIALMAADKQSIYFVENDTLSMIPKNGDAVVRITKGVNTSFKIVPDAENIYFVSNVGSFGTSLNRVLKSGGTVTTLDSGYISSFAVGAEKVFVSDISKVYELKK